VYNTSVERSGGADKRLASPFAGNGVPAFALCPPLKVRIRVPPRRRGEKLTASEEDRKGWQSPLKFALLGRMAR
jgi:hypothetical protein